MKKSWGIVLIALVVVACGGSKKPASSTDEVASLDAGTEPTWSGSDNTPSETKPTPVAELASGTEDGAKSLLKQFVDPKADHAALSKSLRPTAADYKALFDDTTAPKMESAYAKEWDSGNLVIKPKNEKQSEIKIWGATGAELASGGGHAKEFPGGYKKIGKHLAPTVTFYTFKFVEKNHDAGEKYDGLAYVNGHWVIVPKPFHVEGVVEEEKPADKPGKPRGDKPHGQKPHPKKK